MFFSKKIILSFLFLLVVSVSLKAQMPGWITHTDKDGNTYFVDKNLKIYTSEKPDFNYKAVSVDGVDYYLAQGKSLINHQQKSAGLALLKSVRLLADHFPTASQSGMQASRIINKFRIKEGSRFKLLDQSASILMLKKNQNIFLYNDFMRYLVIINGDMNILKRKIIYKHRYLRYGLMFGVVYDKQNQKSSRYDLLCIINSERFNYKISSVTKYEKLCKNKLPSDRFARKLIKETNFQKHYLFSEPGPKSKYMGYELFIINGQVAYFIRIISEKSSFEKYKFRINEMVKSIKISSFKG